MATFAFPDAFGGAERFIHGLSAAQSAAGHEVTLLTGDPGGLPAQETRDGVRVMRYPLPAARGLGFFRGVNAQVTAALSRLRPEAFDVLHVHQIASALGALASPIPARRVLSFHASHQLEFEAERLDGAPEAGAHRLGVVDRIKSFAIGMLDRRALERADRIVVHTRFVLSQVTALQPAVQDRVRIIPPGLDLERFAPGDAADARERLGLPGGVALIVSVRRLVRRMGLDVLIQAAARLAASGTPFVIAIGGVGPERAALEGLRDSLGLQDRVRFLGRVPDSDLPGLLRAADLVVVPSRSMEGFGMSTAEALACGTPVIATDSGASPEILGDLERTLLVPLDPGVLATRIAELLRDAARRDALGMRCAQAMRERYAWPTIVAAMDAVYAEPEGHRGEH